MRHQYSCIDFIELPPANDNNDPPSNAIAASKPPTRPDGTIDRIPADWVLSEELRAAAKMVGVQNPDDHLARLRTGPVGGARGIFPDQLDAYIRGQFGRWRTWEETDRARRVDIATVNPGLTAPAPAERVKGWPAWVRRSQVEKLKAEGRDAAALAKLFARTHHIPPNNLDVAVAAQAFEQFVERVRKEAA